MLIFEVGTPGCFTGNKIQYIEQNVMNFFTSGELSLRSVIVTKKKHVAARGGIPRSVATTVTGYVT